MRFANKEAYNTFVKKYGKDAAAGGRPGGMRPPVNKSPLISAPRPLPKPSMLPRDPGDGRPPPKPGMPPRQKMQGLGSAMSGSKVGLGTGMGMNKMAGAGAALGKAFGAKKGGAVKKAAAKKGKK